MILKIIAALLLSTSITFAAATSSASAPAQKPPKSAKPSTQPVSNYPTPAELIRKMRQVEAEQKVLPTVAYLKLAGPVVEKPPAFSFFGQEPMTLHSLLQRIAKAREDKDVRAVLITLEDTSMNFAQAQEVRDTLASLRKAGKRAFVYADAYDTLSYTVASGATDVCMMGGGEVMIPGVGITTLYAKGLLEKVGVQADYVQIGEYKGADEMFTRTEPSDEARGELNKLMDSMYEQIVDGISFNRTLPRKQVQALIDDTMLNGRAARDRRFVDHLVEADGLRDLIGRELGSKINLVSDYGMKPREAMDLSNPFALLSLLTRKPETPSGKPTIALVAATGMIVDGEGGEGLFGGSSIGSEDIRKALRIAQRDPSIKAIVIRIDSPGGSALASEAMWQAARRLAKNKPVVISIGNMAASGGYYLASAGDHVFADPTAIVGSIGVVGGKFVLKGLFEKVGLSTESFQRGKNADLFSMNTPFSERQRRLVTNWMRQTYDQFTQRVMTTRSGKIKDIDQVARGRIFLAKQACALGMVDEIGGLDNAIAFAAKRVNLRPGQYEVRMIPAPKTFADLISGSAQDSMSPLALKVTFGEASVVQTLSPSMRQLLGQEIQMLQLLQQRPVILVSPVVMTVK